MNAQYHLLRLLKTPENNLCAIGDPDQAIYGFRGSDYKYFLKFKEDFPDSKVINLEKNYRSTTSILEASGQVIEQNPDRKETKIWSDIVSEGKLEIFKTPTEKVEAVISGMEFQGVFPSPLGFDVGTDRAPHVPRDIVFV